MARQKQNWHSSINAEIMLVNKTKPVGIDFYIQQLQNYLYGILSPKWGNYDSYGRCYRNKKGNDYVAEVYNSKNEYQDVYWNDSLNAISFFGIGQNIINGTMDEATVHMVFFVNIANIKPSIAHRADEEVRQDITGLFGKSLYEFSFLSIDLGVDNVLREYPGTRRDSMNVKVDMHPVHCFRLNFKLIYDANKIC